MKMIKNGIKKIVVVVLVFCMVFNTYAKSSGTLVDAPTSEDKNIKATSSVIVHSDSYHEVNPINPDPIGFNREEYDLVNTYVIDIKTIPLRVQYFSPTYLNAKATAENKAKVALYSAGGSEYTLDVLRTTLNDTMPAEAKKYKKQLSSLENQLSKLKQNGITSGATYDAIVSGISQLNVAVSTINATSTQLSTAVGGFTNALRIIGTLDTNRNLVYVKDLLSKNMISAFLSYKQLEFYMEVLNKQTKLYQDMYDIYLENYKLGLSTATEVQQYLLNLENTKTTYRQMKTTISNVKSLLAINLGYDLDDMDKLIFAEPEVDFNYISSINIEQDKNDAVNGNNDYLTLRDAGMSNKKLPGSTSEKIYYDLLNEKKDKILVSIDSLYSNLVNKRFLYESSLFLDEIVRITKDSNMRKKQIDLVSNTEYDGLYVKNLANEMNVKIAKYNLISAINSYSYAVLGVLDV